MVAKIGSSAAGCRSRYLHQVGVARELELDLAIGARGELPGRIIGLHLDQHAARAHVHRVRGRDQLGVELLTGILRQLEARLQPRLEGLVTPDGKLHTEDPHIREAAIKAIEKLTTPYKG